MVVLLVADLSAIRSEPNLERRSDMALDYISGVLDQVRDLYNSGDITQWRDALNRIGEAVELSYESLSATQKNPRNDKHFKRAELKTREFVRRLNALRDQVSFDDRAALDQVRAKVSQVHDELLEKIMSKKK
ncbi:MAG TPA: hypothetical protein VKX39_06275 [Bryobacteraceae bacterium]|nr:hypothetical protein [Bryobacteraceae bacterium]